MVSILYRGNTGNKLFQYAIGRILAEESGLSLRCDPIEHFPELKALDGEIGKGDPLEISDSSVYTNSLSHLAAVCHGKNVLVGGQFEMYHALAPYLARIRSWFKFENNDQLDQTAVHMRGRDHKLIAQLPIDYYEQALDIAGRYNAIVYTDDDCWDFMHLLGLPVVSGEKMSDWNLMRRSKRIVLSLSTFSWWAALLSKADVIVQPAPVRGFRSPEAPMTILEVPEWVSVPCEYTVFRSYTK